MEDVFKHPIADAAGQAGLVAARPATAHPFTFWREKLSSLPIGQIVSFEHRPQEVCGWPLAETTVWSAAFPTPPFEDWPAGYGDIVNYYFCETEARKKAAAWGEAVRALGYEVVVNPVLPKRAAAIRAGLGVPGLAGPLIMPKVGSFVCLIMLLVHTPPPEGTPGPERDESPGCDQCGKCRKACPVGAIGPEGLDATKCLRSRMIKPAVMPEDDFAAMGRKILGCEECQRACPKNQALLKAVPAPALMGLLKLESLLAKSDGGAFEGLIFSQYLKLDNFQLQAVLAAANTGRTDLVPSIRRLETQGDPVLARFAAWALARLG